MKCSVSMLCLSSSPKVQKTPDSANSKLNTSRLCNSLSSKKSRRNLEKKLCRRSWGSTDEMSQEELWKTCLESIQAASELENMQGEAVRAFLEDYSHISAWLNAIQDKRSQIADVLLLSQLSEDMYRNQHVQKEMNERGKILAQTLPKLKEEFQWRMKHMNSQWDSLEKILLCQSSSTSSDAQGAENSPDKEWDINWVSNWLREMENELQPLSFNVHWPPDILQNELARHQALQSEIESKASLVHGALRQSRSEGQGSKKRGDVLEKRWIQLRLRILEWVEHLSRIQQKEATKERGTVSGGSILFEDQKWALSDDEANEPLTKYPRLGSLDTLVDEDGIQLLEQEERMGQSHEVGSVYQSGSPVPNSSVIEFSLDGVSSESVGLKRKSQQSFLSPRVVPQLQQMNISTYYFKHSDTEAEGSLLVQEQRKLTGDPELHQNVANKNYYRSGSSPLLLSSSSHETGNWECQRNLDFSQDLNMNFQGEPEQILSSELAFDFSPELAEEEMDQETTLLINQNLEEIEELVQKAELLVRVGRKRQRASTGGSFRNELVAWGLPATTGSSLLPLFTENTTFLKKWTKSNNTLNENPAEEGTVCPCQLNPEEVGAVGGFCLCGVEGTASGLKGSSATSPKIPKKHSRVRQWVRAHNNPTILNEQKNTSSCDASGESASESESQGTDLDSNDEPQLSSSDDDPTILTASTTLLQQQQQLPASRGFSTSSPKRGSSFNSVISADQSQNDDRVVLRSKKGSEHSGKQRPRSFTDNSSSTHANGFGGFERLRFGKALSPIHDFNHSVFVSDSALNVFEKGESGSGGRGSPVGGGDGSTLTSDRRKGKFRRRLSKQKKRESLDVDLEDELDHFTANSIFGGFSEMEHQLEDIENTLPAVLKPVFKLDQIDTASLITDLPATDQDWDSYQEKYLSEPYSEEPYDQDRTLKLLAFGEDYDQVLDRADSESSSILSSHQGNPRKRRPLTFNTRSEMTESDSDREEFNHFLVQSVTQLRFIDTIFRKQLDNSSGHSPESPSEYAEMEATCEENINSLKLILNNVEKPDALPFGIDVRGIQDVLNSWDLLRGRITQAAKLKQIQDDLKYLRINFESIQRDLGGVDPFDFKDINSLKIKIDRIQSVLNELTSKRRKLQAVNEDSVGTKIYLKDASVDVRKQLKNLYALYEENFQLGSYLLDKMRFLEDAWVSFEQERDAFEKSLAVPLGSRVKGKKSLSSGASTDSGHGTDFSHSDSDIDERRQKLVALRTRALDLKACLPVGSPVLDVIDSKINEAQKDFEMLEKVGRAPLNLKLIFPKRKSPVSIRKAGHRASKSPSTKRSASPGRLRSQSPSSRSSSPVVKKESSRHWRTLRFSLSFHLALMGLFAVAWFLQPKCCENMNTFSFSLVPQLTHDRIPNM